MVLLCVHSGQPKNSQIDRGTSVCPPRYRECLAIFIKVVCVMVYVGFFFEQGDGNKEQELRRL